MNELSGIQCPTLFCGGQTIVADSRPTGKHGSAIRRRRKCTRCLTRFTTFEVKESALADSEHVFEAASSFRKLRKLNFEDWELVNELIDRLHKDSSDGN